MFIYNSEIKKILHSIYRHIGWSKFYEKFILVEPIWCINISENVINFVSDLAYTLYKKKYIGRYVASIIDREGAGQIEQAFILFKKFFFISDNPVLFPHDRLHDLSVLKKRRGGSFSFNGISHFHINEKYHNKNDISVINKFIHKISIKSLYSLIVSYKSMDHIFDELNPKKLRNQYYGDMLIQLFLRDLKNDLLEFSLMNISDDENIEEEVIIRQ